jgi:hypothetical protein
VVQGYGPGHFDPAAMSGCGFALQFHFAGNEETSLQTGMGILFFGLFDLALGRRECNPSRITAHWWLLRGRGCRLHGRRLDLLVPRRNEEVRRIDRR